MRTIETDIVIVGGGFAGLSAAETSARNGANVLVLEKNSEIGYPIHTSGGSWIEDMKDLGIYSHLYHPIERVRFISPNNEAKFNYEKPVFCTVDIRGLYQFLAERAAKRGAKIRVKTTAKEPIIKNGSVEGVIARDIHGKIKIKSRITIDASGFSSVIAKKVGLKKPFKRFAIGAEYDLYAPNYDQKEAILTVGNKFAPAGYGWVFPHGNNRVRVGTGVSHPDVQIDPKDYLDVLIDSLGIDLDKSKQIEYHYGIIPNEGFIRKTVSDGLMVVGDAAGQPLAAVGEGIRVSMKIGKIAGKVATSAITKGDYSTKFLEEYEKLWKKKFEKNLKISYGINKKISSYDDNNWDNSVEALKKLDPEDFYKALRCDFSKKLVFNIIKKNPSIMKSSILNIVKNQL